MGSMKKVTLLLSSLVFMGSLAFADHHGKKWVSLFDGKSLKGWTASKENPDSFSVKNGTLIVDGGRSHLFYTGSVNAGNFKNFELKLRAKTMKNANGGVYFHTAYQDEGWPSQGFECQVNTSQKDPKKTLSQFNVCLCAILKTVVLICVVRNQKPAGGMCQCLIREMIF